MKGQKLNFLEILIFSLKLRYRAPNDFWVPSLRIDFNHLCVKYASYELHQMKEEPRSKFH